MSTNTTTYYVDVNSNYRNLEQYPNPADFGVTFSTFTATGGGGVTTLISGVATYFGISGVLILS